MKPFLLFKTLFLTVFLIGSLAHSSNNSQETDKTQTSPTTMDYGFGPIPFIKEQPNITKGLELIPQNLREMIYLERTHNISWRLSGLLIGKDGHFITLGKGMKPITEPIYFIVVPYKDGFEAINKKEMPAFLQHDKDHFLHPVSKSNFSNSDGSFNHYKYLRKIKELEESPKNLKQLLEKKRKLEKELGDTKSDSFVLSDITENLIAQIKDISKSIDLLNNHNYPVLKNTGWYGSQVQGHNTLLIWNGKDHSQQFFIKYQRYENDGRDPLLSHIYDSVHSSSKLKKLSIKGYKIMEEFFGIQSKVSTEEEQREESIRAAKNLPSEKNSPYKEIFIETAERYSHFKHQTSHRIKSGSVYGLKGFLVRSVEEITNSTHKGHRVLPLQVLLGHNANSFTDYKPFKFTEKNLETAIHNMAFFSPPLIQEFASKSNLTPLEWIKQEYIPKLATLVANQYYRDGSMAGLHTQNALVSITPEGKISHFILRDVTDFRYLDPSQNPPYDETRVSYLEQSLIFDHLPRFYDFSFLEVFFDAYAKRVKEITNIDLKGELSRLKKEHLNPYIPKDGLLEEMNSYSNAYIPNITKNLLDNSPSLSSLMSSTPEPGSISYILNIINTGLLNHVNKNHPEIFKKIVAKQKKSWKKSSCQSTFKKP